MRAMSFAVLAGALSADARAPKTRKAWVSSAEDSDNSPTYTDLDTSPDEGPNTGSTDAPVPGTDAPVPATASPTMGKTALLIVDVQDCFVDNGTLEVPGALRIIPKLNQLRTEKACLFDVVVRTQDFHPAGHISFDSTHSINITQLGLGNTIETRCLRPEDNRTDDAACCLAKQADGTPKCAEFGCTCENNPSCSNNPACSLCDSDPTHCFTQHMPVWHDHCLQNGDSGFVQSLTTDASDIIVQKGNNSFVDAYSAFMDNTKTLKTHLDDVLKQHHVSTIYVAGIATDFCVYYTAVDAVALGYNVAVIEDATAGIGIPKGDNDTIELALEDMRGKGVKLVNTQDVLECTCAEKSTCGSSSTTGTQPPVPAPGAGKTLDSPAAGQAAWGSHVVGIAAGAVYWHLCAL